MPRAAPLTLLLALALGCTPEPAPPKDAPPPAERPLERVEGEGVENVIRLSDKVLSGSQPHGDAGFDALAEMGVKTVISVDGANPDLERAGARGMRYVHLPIGYDGIPEPRALELARAVRELTGPIYIHCHHGKHRGPAAAAVALIGAEHWSQERAVAFLKEAGTSKTYVGLYGSVQLFDPSDAAISAASSEFPETAELPGFVAAMAQLDRRADHLKAAQAAGWQVPADHPDLDPPHEALQAHELLRELDRDPWIQAEDYAAWMRAAVTRSGDLEAALRAGDRAAADAAYASLRTSCNDCHAAYRNTTTK